MSSANSTKFKAIEEVTLGTTPASALTLYNVTSVGLNATVNSTMSAQISSTRATLDSIRTDASSGGDVGFEGQYAAHDVFWESAFASDFNAGQTLTATDISAAAGDNSFNSVAAAFNTSIITPGSVIKIKGFTATANNRTWIVVSATTAKIVVSGGTVTTEAAGNSVTLNAKDLRDGSTRKSFTLESEFSDHTPVHYAIYKGQVVNTATLNSATGSIVTGTFGFTGTTTTYGTTTAGTGADIAATLNDSWSPVGSVGTIYKGGTALSGVCVSSLNLSISNNTRTNQCLGSLYPSDIPLGGFTGTIDATIYFNDIAWINEFLNGTETSLMFQFYDADGNYVSFYAPRIKPTASSLDGITDDGDVTQNITFEILHDSTVGFALQMSSLAA